MKHDPLAKALRALPVPPASEEAKARALHRSLLALGRNEAPAASRPVFAASFRRPLWIALAACFAALLWIGLVEKRHADETASLRAVLKGMEATFQNQLSAVVLKDGEARVVLAKEGASAGDRPLLITIHPPGGGSVTRILTFSGQWIDLPLERQSVRVQVVERASGGFALMGDRLLWDKGHPSVDGMRIEGRFL